MSFAAVIIAIFAVLAALIVIWLVTGYNGFVKAGNNVEESFATMDVYLKKRSDLIPNLVETVKAYGKYEAETLEQVMEARNAARRAQTVEAKAQKEQALDGSLSNLFALAENYPELKANQNFLDLQRQLQTAEEDIANARKYYNAVVKIYNNKCQMFPGNLLAELFHFKEKPMFEVAEQERENVKVKF